MRSAGPREIQRDPVESRGIPWNCVGPPGTASRGNPEPVKPCGNERGGAGPPRRIEWDPVEFRTPHNYRHLGGLRDPVGSRGIPLDHPVESRVIPWDPVDARGIPWDPVQSRGNPGNPVQSHGIPRESI